MSSDESGRPVQRYSRFSRSIYEDASPPRPPEEPSLTDIAARALRASYDAAPPRRAPSQDLSEHRQPPPPEPSPHWIEPARQQASKSPPLRLDELRPAFGREAPAAAPKPDAVRAEAVHRAAEPPETSAIAEAAHHDAPPQENAAAEPGRLSRTVHAVRVKAGPALVKSAFWLAHNLRRREIRKRYNKALVFGHTRIADRSLEKLFFVPTLKGQLIDPAPERGILYDGPVPASVFDWVMAQIVVELRHFAFIDIRAGRGRTSLLAAKCDFSRIMAYEYDAQLFDDLSMNIAQFPRSLMACRNIDSYRGDIQGILLPDQPCVIYFSGAWREHIIPGVMDYIRETYRKSPRRIYVILENVAEDTAIPADDIFQKLETGLAERLKLRLLSPMDFRIYRSAV